ncbi:MAG: (2Fe-2S) ferredoxin domain-containing protein [Lentisphaeria bacterium]|nr:(2Fe-2S) ferredoxin domain-containing protein [Lentisphaeria bacterium]
MEQTTSRYECHVFVCTNDRHGERKSCADGDAALVRSALKKGVGDRGWKPRVRVSQAGCLGVCAKGPNVMIYPQKIHFSAVTLADVDAILDYIASVVD